MGLDIRPGGARWSYGGFSAFRERLAAADGIVLAEMDGFGGRILWDSVVSALTPLLNHSDCDGYIDSYDAKEVARRVRSIIADWDTHDYDRQQAERLCDGLEHCADHGCALVFA